MLKNQMKKIKNKNEKKIKNQKKAFTIRTHIKNFNRL